MPCIPDIHRRPYFREMRGNILTLKALIAFIDSSNTPHVTSEEFNQSERDKDS